MTIMDFCVELIYVLNVISLHTPTYIHNYIRAIRQYNNCSSDTMKMLSMVIALDLANDKLINIVTYL